MGRATEVAAPSSSMRTDGGPVAQVNDLSRSLTAFDPISTLVAVVEMSKASWLVSGVVPGVERQPLKKLEPDATALLRLIERWRNEAVRAGRPISRIALAYEAGRDGFWLARWLIARGIEAHVIHSASVAVSRERKRAKTDRLDAAMLMRVFLGWLRGERGHCGMVAIPTMEEEDARRRSRERESLVNERSRITNRMKSALARLGVGGIQATSAQGARASGRSADSGGHGPAGEHHRGIPARHSSTASTPDFSGIWGHPYITGGLEPPLVGPGPVTNRSRRNGVSNVYQYVGDYSNPILKPQAAEVVKKHGN